MEKLMTILSEIRPDLDFENDTNLVDGGSLDSFDMVLIIAAISENYGVEIKGTDLTPANFNSAVAILELINKELQK